MEVYLCEVPLLRIFSLSFKLMNGYIYYKDFIDGISLHERCVYMLYRYSLPLFHWDMKTLSHRFRLVLDLLNNFTRALLLKDIEWTEERYK